jgi:hypothetical protein
MRGPLDEMAWDEVCALARSSVGLFQTRQDRLGTAAFMARTLIEKHGGALDMSGLDDLQWVAAGGDPLDPLDAFLEGRPSLRLAHSSPTIAVMLAGLSQSAPGA